MIEVNRAAGFSCPAIVYNPGHTPYLPVNDTHASSGMVMLYDSPVLEWPRAEVPTPQADGFHHIHELLRYVRDLAGARDGEQLISPILAESALELWWEVWFSTGGQLNVPDASPGPNGELLYVWKQREHYLSVETHDQGPAEFFYRNTKTGEIWGCDYPLDGQDASQELKIKLRNFRKGE